MFDEVILSNMSTDARRKAPKILFCRPCELTPLVEAWLNSNPHKGPSDLVREGLRMALKKTAGKRYAHLVEAA